MQLRSLQEASEKKIHDGAAVAAVQAIVLGILVSVIVAIAVE